MNVAVCYLDGQVVAGLDMLRAGDDAQVGVMANRLLLKIISQLFQLFDLIGRQAQPLLVAEHVRNQRPVLARAAELAEGELESALRA